MCCTLSCIKPWLLSSLVLLVPCKLLLQRYSRCLHSDPLSHNKYTSNLDSHPAWHLSSSFLVTYLCMLCRRRNFLVGNLNRLLKPKKMYWINRVKYGITLPGHPLVLHIVNSLSDPMHPLPPWDGEGLLHFLVLTFWPELQVLLQDP